MNEEIAAQMVAAGGKWFDRHGPERWWNMPDMEQLDVRSSYFCPLGQVFGSRPTFESGMTGYEWAVTHFNMSDDLAIGCGFYACDAGEAVLLNTAWIDYIVARRVAEQESWVNADDLATSLGQMRRGEGRVVRPGESETDAD